MRPLVALCYLGLAGLGRRTGAHRAREEHLAAATALFREMGMANWREQADMTATRG